ncbi:MAG TPA: MFS transporter, partial [Candidatus Limnocylindrales bacterium]|nr:MFS transporter [Candidatus Limnocylindrales bacterium]
MQTPPRPSLIRNRDFQKLWTAETISVFGSQVSALAIPLTAALILKVEPFAFALLGTIEFLPFILFTLPAGAWVDRLQRRPILISGDLGRALALATIPAAYFLGVLSIWQLYVVGFVTGTLTVFFDVANQSYLPSIVERDELVEGNSKLQISQSAAQIAGPGIAGYLVGIVTAPIAILLDSL